MTPRPTAPSERGSRSFRLATRTIAVLAIGVLASTTLGTLPAHAARTLYVDVNAPNCLNQNSAGSAEQPFCNIGWANNNVQAGDTVQVAPGTYAEQVTTRAKVTYVAPQGATIVRGGATGNYGFIIQPRTAGTTTTPADGVTIDGFTIQGQGQDGIALSDATNTTVRDVTITGVGRNGIRVTRGSGNSFTGVTVTGAGHHGIFFLNTSGNTLASAEISDNGFHGVRLQDSPGHTLRDITSEGNATPDTTRQANGISLWNSPGATIEQNTTHGNEDSGIELFSGSHDAVVRRNLTYANGDHGIDLSASQRGRVTSNTVVGNTTSGINIERNAAGIGSTNTTVRNNIAVDNATNSPRAEGDIRVDVGSVTGTTLDRDLVHQSTGSAPVIEWNDTEYGTLDDFRAATGQEQNGKQADPRFASGYQLGDGSPAVDSADAGSPGFLTADRRGVGPYDDQGVPNTGAGSPPYADLGALERTSDSTTAPPVLPTDALPVAALTATPTTVVTGETVTLDASASTDDNGITDYRFNCGDSTAATTGATPTATCTYTTAGTYTATVTVTDTTGQTADATATVTITATEEPPPPPG